MIKLTKNRIIVFYSLLFIAALFLVPAAHGAYERFSPGDPVTITEFVYDDDFVPTTTPCTLSVYYPNGDPFVLPGGSTMNAEATGRHYKVFTPDSTEGVWPANMSCGTAGVDLAILDKTFVVGYANASTTAIADSVWDVQTSTLATIGSVGKQFVTNLDAAISGVAASVWGVATSTFGGASNFGGQIVSNLDATISDVASSVWGFTTRFLTGRELTDGGYLATENYINFATSTIATNIVTNIETASSSLGILVNTRASSVSLENASSSLGALVNTRASSASLETASSSLSAMINTGWTVSLSDFGVTSPGESYRAKLQILNYKTEPANPDVDPTWVIYDPEGNPVIPSGVMTTDSAGTYHYGYTIPGLANTGVWETEVSVVINGQTIKVNDYWEVSGPPPHVSVNDVYDNQIEEIWANVTIINEGLIWYEYHYEWCVITSGNDACNDDAIYWALNSESIDSGEIFNTNLRAIVPLVGDYYFKLVVYWGTETSASFIPFTAINETVVSCGDGTCNGSENCSSCPSDCGICPPGGGPGGGGGGGAGDQDDTPAATCDGADFNHDNNVNSTDFSILLAFWKTVWPFLNSCVDINGDQQVNSVDFSILMYEWGT